MVDRLSFTDGRFNAMVEGVRYIASLPDPVGEVLKDVERPSGIRIRRVRVPFGVVAVVFESRPNVFVDTAALCLKAGNAIILRGGKEAVRSNAALAESVRKVARELVQFVEITSHETVTELVRAVGLVDVAIPRGGERLIKAMCEAALVPVLKHYKGVCHIYVDGKADLRMALKILDNAKTQRPGVCNAAECLLVSKEVSRLFMPMVEAWAAEKGVTLHHGEAGSEYLSLDINVEEVSGVEEAIAFINSNSSGHSDCIVTADEAAAARFLREVDSSSVYHNVSTRFTDGAEFGMGAEIGISTDKLHARGPMGLEELTTYKYMITGDGVVRE
jgi:glutamate-5-semialdehyde dehydrogenase